MAQQARQVLAACEKSPVDTVVLDYDTRNPFDVCSVTFTPIYRGAPPFLAFEANTIRFHVQLLKNTFSMNDESGPMRSR